MHNTKLTSDDTTNKFCLVYTLTVNTHLCSVHIVSLLQLELDAKLIHRTEINRMNTVPNQQGTLQQPKLIK